MADPDPKTGDHDSDYGPHKDEMTTRALFYSTGTNYMASYTTYNNKIWDLLRGLCKDHL
jgi:hypothetical protein